MLDLALTLDSVDGALDPMPETGVRHLGACLHRWRHEVHDQGLRGLCRQTELSDRCWCPSSTGVETCSSVSTMSARASTTPNSSGNPAIQRSSTAVCTATVVRRAHRRAGV